MGIFDSHAHYCDESFDEDRASLLDSMKENGISFIMEVGAGRKSSEDAVKLAGHYDFVYASVGIHPDDTDNIGEENMDRLKELAKNDKVRAIGEIGLDYYYEEPGREVQKKWFARQLELAKELAMPVIIHSRDAAKDTYDIMDEHCNWENGGVIHCFSYPVEMAEKFVKKGFYVGIGGVLTFKNSKKLLEVARLIPLENIILETDCPYMAPVPDRGQRNDSRKLKYVVEKMAEIKGISKDEVVEVTRENALRMYGLK